MKVKRWHVVSDRNPANGMFVAASLMAAHEDGSRVVTCSEFLSETTPVDADCEVWVHGCWLPCYWKACRKVLKAKTANHRTAASRCDLTPRLVRMTHANLDPVRYRFHGWKKRLVAPVERWLFGKCDRVAVTCAEERKWCEAWGVKGPFEVIDLKRFFDFKKEAGGKGRKDEARPLHVLCLGRQHPLKGAQYLERAVECVKGVELREVSDHFDAALEEDWKWCDVLCLPTLSENFGLVVAEALERGKRVITTDGAPAWDPEAARDQGGGGPWQESLVYLRGYRAGSDETRVRLLKKCLEEERVRI